MMESDQRILDNYTVEVPITEFDLTELKALVLSGKTFTWTFPSKCDNALIDIVFKGVQD